MKRVDGDTYNAIVSLNITDVVDVSMMWYFIDIVMSDCLPEFGRCLQRTVLFLFVCALAFFEEFFPKKAPG